jgi:putative FmdB family regulatory protein
LPIYEYECRSCGKSVDIRHGFKEKVEQKCAECGGELARRFHAAGIVFKGSGFYVTDSRKSSGGEAKKSSGSEAKSDAKPAESKSSDAASTTSPSESKPDAPKGKGDAAA